MDRQRDCLLDWEKKNRHAKKKNKKNIPSLSSIVQPREMTTENFGSGEQQDTLNNSANFHNK